jgi:hypothetical protein
MSPAKGSFFAPGLTCYRAAGLLPQQTRFFIYYKYIWVLNYLLYLYPVIDCVSSQYLNDANFLLSLAVIVFLFFTFGFPDKIIGIYFILILF